MTTKKEISLQQKLTKDAKENQIGRAKIFSPLRVLCVLLLMCFSLRVSAQTDGTYIRISGDSAVRYPGSATDSNTLEGIQFVRGDFVAFDFALYDRGNYRSNISMFATINLQLFAAQNTTNAPILAQSITNGTAFWNGFCPSNNWVSNTPGFTNYNVEFQFTDAQTSFSLNNQAAQSFWLRIYAVTTDSIPRTVTYLECPVTVYDGPISPFYTALNWPMQVYLDGSDFLSQQSTAAQNFAALTNALVTGGFSGGGGGGGGNNFTPNFDTNAGKVDLATTITPTNVASHTITNGAFSVDAFGNVIANSLSAPALVISGSGSDAVNYSGGIQQNTRDANYFNGTDWQDNGHGSLSVSNVAAAGSITAQTNVTVVHGQFNGSGAGLTSVPTNFPGINATNGITAAGGTTILAPTGDVTVGANLRLGSGNVEFPLSGGLADSTVSPYSVGGSVTAPQFNATNQSVNGSGFTGDGSGLTNIPSSAIVGGGGSGIATSGGIGTNTYLTNATSSGERATNLTIVSGNISGATNLPPSGLSGGSASAGQVLEWNGTAWVPTSIASYVNITSEGGVGDGVTDNTAAVSNAMAAAGNGGAIYFPRGKYKVAGNINVTNANLTILGDGAGSWALGQADTFVSAIIWSNLATNCFNAQGSYLTFQNIAGFWTNTAAPTSGAFVCATTNADQVNGAVSVNWNNVLLDGGYRCVDYQAGQGWQAFNLSWIRWWQDGIRINNYANVDVGGWSIINSGWEALGNGHAANWSAGSHISRSAIRWEGSGGGQILNSGGGAFNWGSYGDTGGYTNAIDVQPQFQSGAGSDTSGLFVNNCIIDNWTGNAIYTHSGTGAFVSIRIIAVQAESFANPGTPISLTQGIGNGGLIDGLSIVSGGINPGGYPVYLQNMTGVDVGYVVSGTSISGAILNSGSTAVTVLPDGTGFYDPDQGMPQIREGGYFVQSQTNGSWTQFAGGYYTAASGGGLYYSANGPAMSEDVYNNYLGEPITFSLSFYPSNVAGTVLGFASQTNMAEFRSKTAMGWLNMTKYGGPAGAVLFATNTGNVGINTTTPAAALTVNGSAVVSNNLQVVGAITGSINGSNITGVLQPSQMANTNTSGYPALFSASTAPNNANSLTNLGSQAFTNVFANTITNTNGVTWLYPNNGQFGATNWWGANHYSYDCTNTLPANTLGTWSIFTNFSSSAYTYRLTVSFYAHCITNPLGSFMRSQSDVVVTNNGTANGCGAASVTTFVANATLGMSGSALTLNTTAGGQTGGEILYNQGSGTTNTILAWAHVEVNP